MAFHTDKLVLNSSLSIYTLNTTFVFIFQVVCRGLYLSELPQATPDTCDNMLQCLFLQIYSDKNQSYNPATTVYITKTTKSCVGDIMQILCVASNASIQKNVFKRLHMSKEEPTCCKLFSAGPGPAPQFPSHLLHQWRTSIWDSGYKYLWLTCSKFLSCHITT